MSDAIDLHRRLLTLDSHIDIPWPDGPAFAAETSRRVDLPKMRRGHLACGFFAAYVPQVRRTPDADAASFARAEAMLQAIAAMGDAAGARLCRTADDIEAAWRDGMTGVVPAVENGQACGGNPLRVRRFADLGARYMTLTHTGHNALADSSNPRADLGDAATEHGGLSDTGRAAIAEMNRVGMVIDISHVSKAAMLQAAAVSRTPVVATHSCIKALCDNLRNLDDEQLDALRDAGGVAQITAVPYFLKASGKADNTGPADFADHVDYAVRRVGLAHVGISSDFDGGGGFTGGHDAAESPSITTELARRGYGEAELAALWSGNFLRVLRAAEAAAS